MKVKILTVQIMSPLKERLKASYSKDWHINSDAFTLFYLRKGFLPVVFEVFRVHIEVVFVDGEWLGALSDAGYELLHLQESAAGPVAFKVPHGDVGGSDTICRQETKGELQSSR